MVLGKITVLGDFSPLIVSDKNASLKKITK